MAPDDRRWTADEARLACAFPGAVWTTDRDLRFTAGFGRLWETPETRPVGRTVAQWFGPGSGNPIVAAHERALAGETAIVDGVGIGLDLRLRVEPLRDDDGIVGTVGVATHRAGTDPEHALTERRYAQAAAVAALGLAAVRSEDLDALFVEAARSVRAELNATGAGVLELLPDGETLRVIHVEADDPRGVPRYFELKGTLTALALERDEPVMSGDLSADDRLTVAVHPYQSAMAAPIGKRQGNFGAITAGSAELHAFAETDLFFLRAVANVLSGAIEREGAMALATAAFGVVPDALLIADDSMTIVDVNAAAEELTSRPRAELVGRPASVLSMDPEGTAARIEVLRTGQPIEATTPRPDGSLRNVVVSMVADFQPGRHLFVARDVTEQRRLERELQQAQKMELVGQLAAGVAHDFNNLLVAVRGLSSVVLDELEPGSVFHGDIEAIHAAGVRGIAAVDRLLSFARPPSVEEMRVVDAATVVEGLRPLLRQLVRADVELGVAVDPDATLLVAPTDLEHAILNLVVNAQDAIPGRGAIRIEIDTREIREPEAARLGVAPDRYVSIAVADDGAGMDEATLAQSTSPFFTTKSPERGTGLGLPMVERVVRAAGGALTLESEISVGTTATMVFPAVSAGPADAEVAEGHEGRHGSETVLVVDDDPLVLRFVDRALRRLGYTVVATSSAHEAMATVSERPEIAAAVLDIVMPELDGRELAQRLQAVRPDLAICFVSAHHDQGPAKVLRKPFTESELAQALGAALRENGERS